MRLRKLLSLVAVVPCFLLFFVVLVFPAASVSDASVSEEASDHFVSLHADVDYDRDDHHKINDMPAPALPKKAYPQLPYCGELRHHLKDGQHAEGDKSKNIVPQYSPVKGRHTVVATLDGQLSLLDHSGRMIWTVKTGEVFSSTISRLPVQENGKWIHLIPSLTGSLYKYDGDSLHPMPLNAEVLLHRSFKLSNDVVMSGGKEIRTYGIDIATGAVRYECGMEGCTSAATATESSYGKDVILVVKKQMQTVRAIDSVTGVEKWNFSVSTHELALAGVQEGCYEGEMRDGVTESMIKVMIPDGLVMGAGPDNHSVWQHKFDHPIHQTWVIENGKLTIVDPIKHSILDQSPVLYIGKHDHQLYVQESQLTAEKIETTVMHYVGKPEALPKQLEIGWKPNYALQELQKNALAPYQGDFPGLYLYDTDEIESRRHGIPDLDDEKDGSYLLPPIWYWWKEVLGFSLVLAVVLNALLMWPLTHIVQADTVQRMLFLFKPFRKQQRFEAMLSEVSEERPMLEALPAPESDRTLSQPRRSRTRTLSTSSSASQNFLDESIAPFVSQYLREFEPIQCLGRGGFGVVFEAKKKIDDRHYAVKRILLPNSEKSRGRVMREVKALAKLDHRNIVRYFNAWIENPPIGWLEENDPLWNDCAHEVSTGYSPSSMEVGSTFDKGDFQDTGRVKRGIRSELSFPNESQNDDSFIVFVADGHTGNAEKSGYTKIDFAGDGSCGTDIQRNSTNTAHYKRLPYRSTESDTRSGGGFFQRPTSLRLSSVAECSMDNGEVEQEADEEVEKSDDDGGFPSETYLYIQQELCQKRTLQEWLRVTKDRSHHQVIQLFVQIVDAVEYIHMNKLIHRDLKPGNIFLASGENLNSENTDEILTVKIGDFGLATTAVSRFDKDVLTPSLGNPPPAQAVNLTGHVGTHMYMSPEQTFNKPYDFKVDIYSLGLIFFELLVPFSTDMERHESLSKVRKMKFAHEFKKNHEKEHSIIERMVSHNPFSRPNASEIKVWLSENLTDRPTKSYSAPKELSSVIRSTSSDTTSLVDRSTVFDRGVRLSKNHSFT